MTDLGRQIGERAQAAAEATPSPLLDLVRQHGDARVLALAAPGVDEGEHYRFPPCRTPGLWRPLLVGGDPAPEREPRTWPQSVAPDDIADALEVKGHGRFVVVVRRAMPPGGTTYIHTDDVDEHGVQRGLTWTLGRLRELGDVTEVFDVPGGAR